MPEDQSGGEDLPRYPGTWPPLTSPGGFAQTGGYSQTGGYGASEYGTSGYGSGGFPGQQPLPPRPGRSRGCFIYVVVAAVAAAVGAGLVATLHRGSSGQSPAASSPVSASSPSGGAPSTGGVSSAQSQAIARRVEPGVVDISSNLQYEGDTAAATGMVISSSGLVLTNNHVIDDTTGLTATLISSGRKFTAQWLGYDQSDDVSVIRLEGASGLTKVPLGDSSAVKTGENVVAIGNAGGLGGPPSVVTGSITDLNQTISASLGSLGGTETLSGMLETNADIVEGDSGGPLVSASGDVIGMDTASSNTSFTSQGTTMGFAIPINKALSIADQIIAGKSSSTVRIGASGFLGVLLASGSGSSDSSPAQQQKSQLGQNGNSRGEPPGAGQSCVQDNQSYGVPSAIAPVSSGALVLGDLCGTPASAAGISAGDVITAVNGHTVNSPDSLTATMLNYRPGSTVRVTWVDASGTQQTSRLDLIAAPPA